jgi:exosortase/archaeosortase family protein
MKTGLSNVTRELIGPKTILGLALIATSILLYVGFEFTYKTYLVPLGVGTFIPGFYLSLSKVKALQPIKKVLTFVVIGILVFWIFSTAGWDKYIQSSPYAMALAQVTTKVTVAALNFFNIHATQVSNTIIFPPESKLHQVDVAPICAGLHLIALFIASFGLMLLDIGRKATKKQLATLFVIGVGGLFLANLMRVIFLAYVAYAYGGDALSTDHTFAGAIIFLSLIPLFWWFSLKWILKKPHVQQSHV